MHSPATLASKSQSSAGIRQARSHALIRRDDLAAHVAALDAAVDDIRNGYPAIAAHAIKNTRKALAKALAA